MYVTPAELFQDTERPVRKVWTSMPERGEPILAKRYDEYGMGRTEYLVLREVPPTQWLNG